MAMKTAAFLAALALGATAARADVWDLGTETDELPGNANELVHGLSQVHDLGTHAGGVVDVDWYPLRIPHGRSVEVRVDGMTGDVGLAAHQPAVDLIEGDTTTFLQEAQTVTSYGTARSLRVKSAVVGTTGYTHFFVRVTNPQCGTACTGDDEYRIRAFDTTLSLPRFNNGNGQVTVFVLQNPTRRDVTWTAAAWSAGGVFLGDFGGTLEPYATAVTNLAAVNGGALNGQSGSLIVASDAPYQSLTGKGVAVEPATGFTFDTELASVPR